MGTQEPHFKTYLTINGDMWDSIAKKTLGDESRVSHLHEVNRKLIKVVIFPADVAIIVPEITEIENGDVPPWMR